jgi:hypothetical protein
MKLRIHSALGTVRGWPGEWEAHQRRNSARVPVNRIRSGELGFNALGFLLRGGKFRALVLLRFTGTLARARQISRFGVC